ncbi:MAG: hypothetical protein KDD46_00875 [Bdellovibrionales bacterium]|nr:hypothetical protein [Bdellovibrionales bacterium]
MGWKDYQKNVTRKSVSKKRLRQIMLAGISFLAVLSIIQWLSALELPRQKKQPDADISSQSIELPIEAVTVGAPRIKIFQNGQDVIYDLSIQPSLQKFVDQKLEKYNVDWAGVAVMEPSSGRVLALSSYSAKNPEHSQLSLAASFPAASIFKVVTASALLEETPQSGDSVFTYAGDMRRINSKYLHSHYRGTQMSLTKAFAMSANGIFGVIGSQYLNADLLKQYAKQFGFNESIPFELPIEVSTLEVDSESSELSVAKLAAGFGQVTLSPLHGAMIASSIVNNGNMMKPTIIDQISTQDETLYRMEPVVWKTSFSSANAKDLQVMMKKTVTSGTARKAFGRAKYQNVLKNLEIGGKTGSLFGTNPKGRNEWFVSYAKDPDSGQALAVGIVIVNEKYWKIKPAQLSNWIYQEYFKHQNAENVVASQRQVHGRKIDS